MPEHEPGGARTNNANLSAHLMHIAERLLVSPQEWRLPKGNRAGRM